MENLTKITDESKPDNRPPICVFDIPIMESTKYSKQKSSRPPLAMRKHGVTPLMTASSMVVRQSNQNQDFQAFQKQFSMNSETNQLILKLMKSPKEGT